MPIRSSGNESFNPRGRWYDEVNHNISTQNIEKLNYRLPFHKYSYDLDYLKCKMRRKKTRIF